jgi:multiple sugar transport system permease protein
MSPRHIVSLAASYLALALLALLFLAPILLMVVGSLKPEARVLVDAGNLKAFWPAQWDLGNYRDVVERVNFVRYLFNSLIITGMVVSAGLVVNSMAGYAFARLEWQGRKWLFALVLAILILPLEAIAVPLFYQVTLFGWRDTYLVQIVPFIANAFSVYLFYTFFLGLPRELEEAARLDGAGMLRTFIMIIVPNSKPVFASVAILTFLIQWGVFLWPLMVTSGEAVRPLSLAIATFYTLPPLQWGDIFAFGVMMVLPILLVFLFFQRWFIRGVVASGIKG